MPLQNYDEQRKRKELKEFILKNLRSDNIEQIRYSELKKIVEGESLLGRIQYRRHFGTILKIDKDFVDRYGLTSKSQKDAQMNDAN